MHKKTFIYAFLSLAILASLGVSTASAHGWFAGGELDPETVATRQTQMFEHQASLLGITVDQVKDYWSQGKNIRDIAEELGLSDEQLREKLQTERQARLTERLQLLVDNGVVSQAQATARLSAMQNADFQGGFGPRHASHMGGQEFNF